MGTVQALLELYGAGLERIVRQVGKSSASALATDQLVEHLLLVHGLHPVSVEDRVRAALDGVRPYLGSHGGDVELLGRGVVARSLNWLGGTPAVGDELSLQIRHRSAPARATVVRLDTDEIELALDDPVSAIAPGQSLVLYDGDRVLGGGSIDRGRRIPLRVVAA